MEKENNPPQREPAREDLFKSCSVPTTPTTTPVLGPLSAKSTSREGELDARDLEMSQKVRRSYSRLEGLGALTTSTPGHRAPLGFSGADDLPRVSPVVAAKSTEVSGEPAKPWALDTALPGISPLVPKEKRKKKKVPQILVSERLATTAGRKAAPLGQDAFPPRSHIPICTPFLSQKSELDEWAAVMNAEFEAAERFDLVVE